MTQQEIRELRINAEAMSLMETLCDDVRDVAKKYVSALERLAILETAVDWHGWDEVPESKYDVCIIDVLKRGKIADQCAYDTKLGRFLCSGELTAQQMKEKGHVGWRYPVGDLSE